MLTKTILIIFAVSFAAANETLTGFLEGNKQFTAKVYKQVSTQQKNKNFLVCPFSAETILALAQTGARNKTGEEIRSALHLPNDPEEIDAIFGDLLPKLHNNPSYKLHTANKIYVGGKYTIRENFTHVATEIYRSSTENIDFSNPEEASSTINRWVAQQTQNKIENLIEPGTLDEDTVAILINALYFQGSWLKNFKKTLTQPKNFSRSRHDVIQVEMMRKSDFYGFYASEDLEAKILLVPFRGGRDVNMVVVLPNRKNGLKELEKKVDKVFQTPEFKWEYVDVSLPKFKIETTVDFKKILKSLGVKKAFTRADFSGMAGEKGEIHISDVTQKTFISIDEYGVEAAAATSVVFRPKSLFESHGKKKRFVADHPFLFYIKIHDVVIFTGRVVSP